MLLNKKINTIKFQRNFKHSFAKKEYKRQMNRRGHLPTILLGIVALVLMLVSWFVFLSYDKSTKADLSAIDKVASDFERDAAYVPAIFESIVSRVILQADKNNFRASFEEKFVEIAGKVDSVGDVSGNFFGKIRNKEYNLREENGIYTLEIKDVLIFVSDGKNEIKMDFGYLSLKFDKNKVIGKVEQGNKI